MLLENVLRQKVCMYVIDKKDKRYRKAVYQNRTNEHCITNANAMALFVINKIDLKGLGNIGYGTVM